MSMFKGRMIGINIKTVGDVIAVLEEINPELKIISQIDIVLYTETNNPDEQHVSILENDEDEE